MAPVNDVRYDDEAVARDFEATRYRSLEVLDSWCERLGQWFAVGPVQRLVLDVGSGTGIWAVAIAERFGLPVVGIEPAAGMREVARDRPGHPLVAYTGGLAGALPLRDGSATSAWLSTVVHQFPDLPGALAELRRVLVAGAPIVVRTFLPERHPDTDLYVHFPGARQLPVSALTVDGLDSAFAAAGFRRVHLDAVTETRWASYDEVLADLPRRRRSDSALASLADDQWEAGLASLREARDRGATPAPFAMDILVFV